MPDTAASTVPASVDVVVVGLSCPKRVLRPLSEPLPALEAKTVKVTFEAPPLPPGQRAVEVISHEANGFFARRSLAASSTFTPRAGSCRRRNGVDYAPGEAELAGSLRSP